MIAREAIITDPRVLAAGASAREAAELLTRPSVRSVLVVDGERLVGSVTLESIARAVAGGRDVLALSAGEICDEEVATIGPDMPLEDAIHLMAERSLDRLAVVEHGRLLGVLPAGNLVRRLAEEEELEGAADPGADP